MDLVFNGAGTDGKQQTSSLTAWKGILKNIRPSRILDHPDEIGIESVSFLPSLPCGMRSLFLWRQQKRNNVFSLRPLRLERSGRWRTSWNYKMKSNRTGWNPSAGRKLKAHGRSRRIFALTLEILQLTITLWAGISGRRPELFIENRTCPPVPRTCPPVPKMSAHKLNAVSCVGRRVPAFGLYAVSGDGRRVSRFSIKTCSLCALCVSNERSEWAVNYYQKVEHLGRGGECTRRNQLQ